MATWQERTPLFDGEAPPATILTVDVRVEDFIGPSEDRDCWTILSLSTEGIFGLPEALTALGTSPEDFQAVAAVAFSSEVCVARAIRSPTAHRSWESPGPLPKASHLVPRSFGEGLLTKPAEAPVASSLSDAMWLAVRGGLSVPTWGARLASHRCEQAVFKKSGGGPCLPGDRDASLLPGVLLSTLLATAAGHLFGKEQGEREFF